MDVGILTGFSAYPLSEEMVFKFKKMQTFVDVRCELSWVLEASLNKLLWSIQWLFSKTQNEDCILNYWG